MKPTEAKKIFFVDDEPGVRKAVGQSLSQLDNCRTVCLPDAESCLKELVRQSCDLVITDINMPDMDGLELLERIKKRRPKLPVILVTGYGDVPMAVRGIRGGAADFIEKPLDEATFLPVVKTVLKNSPFQPEPGEVDLTKAEIDVLRQIIDGKSNKLIALEQRRSVRTIENHRHRLMKKLGVGNTAELVRKAMKMGFIADETG